eukprot:TRINITY_DN20210_c0_g1_i1.p1 TRINITY_DN20210_c0_g1~~TRINITY_DN20210_c0_g1_i1.p1  ORF type:complete len:670 (+),score=115.72 TRINITY_DN20210_c0_g1_i1:96-2012(+)
MQPQVDNGRPSSVRHALRAMMQSALGSRLLLPLCWLAVLLALRRWHITRIIRDRWRRWRAKQLRRASLSSLRLMLTPQDAGEAGQALADPFVRLPDAGQPGAFEDIFKGIRRIVDSSFGSVFECHRSGAVGQMSVVKIVRRREHPLLRVAQSSPRRRFSETDEFKMYMQKLLVLEHPNVVRYLEFFADTTSFYFVMERLAGRTLLDHLLTVSEWHEADVLGLMSQLLKALSYIHSLDVVHRDVKLENLMALPDEACVKGFEQQGVVLKLLDFGLGCHSSEAKGFMGTPGYMAPEVFGVTPYSYSVDLFAAGVVFHLCLTGNPPFRPPISMRALDEHLQALLSGPDLSRDPLNKVSMYGRELLDWMLLPGPSARCSAAEALRHPWFIAAARAKKEAPVLWSGSSSELRFLRVMGVWNGTSSAMCSVAGKDSLQVIDEGEQEAEEEAEDEPSEQLCLRLVRHMEVPVCICDPLQEDCPIVAVSCGFEALTGYAETDVLGQNCRFLNTPRASEVLEEPRAQLRAAAHGERTFLGVLPNVRKDGSYFENCLHVSSIDVQGRSLVVGIQMEVAKEVDGSAAHMDHEVLGAARKVHSALRHWQRSSLASPGKPTLGLLSERSGRLSGGQHLRSSLTQSCRSRLG